MSDNEQTDDACYDARTDNTVEAIICEVKKCVLGDRLGMSDDVEEDLFWNLIDVIADHMLDITHGQLEQMGIDPCLDENSEIVVELWDTLESGNIVDFVEKYKKVK